MVCYTELSPTGSEIRALIGNPRSLQQLVGQLPICCCSKAKKFNDFSRARGRVCVRGEQALPASPSRRCTRDSSVCFQ